MQLSPSDEQLLLKSLFEGERTVFWQLWMPHQDYLYDRCLTWMDGNVTDAQDALSQATLKAWEKLFLHVDKINNLKVWLTRFTYNLCMDIRREHGKKAKGVENIEEIAGQIEDIKSPVESPESAILGSQIEITIRRAINALPLPLRSPFIMRFEQDMSYLDIAQKLGISTNTVYKRISQARAILKPKINKYLAEDDDSAFLEILLPSINKEKPTEANLNQELLPSLLIPLELLVKLCPLEG